MKNSAIVRLFSIVLQAVLILEAAGCLLGGSLLVIAPDGRLMDMPVAIMYGTFRDFLIPGMLLFCLGLLNAIAFWVYIKKLKLQWALVFGALVSLLGWFWIEIAILRQIHWLHAVWGGPVVLAIIAALFLYPWQQKSKL